MKITLLLAFALSAASLALSAQIPQLLILLKNPLISGFAKCRTVDY